MAEKELMNLPKNTISSIKQFETKQSANSLFRFVEKFDYLLDILKNKALIPRYCCEDVKPYNINQSIYIILWFVFVIFRSIEYTNILIFMEKMDME